MCNSGHNLESSRKGLAKNQLKTRPCIVELIEKLRPTRKECYVILMLMLCDNM